MYAFHVASGDSNSCLGGKHLTTEPSISPNPADDVRVAKAPLSVVAVGEDGRVKGHHGLLRHQRALAAVWALSLAVLSRSSGQVRQEETLWTRLQSLWVVEP